MKKKPFENIVENRENAGNQHFLHFPHFFLLFPKFEFSVTFILLSADAFNLNQCKDFSVGKELKKVLKCKLVNPFPNDKFLGSSKLKEFANNNSKFDKNGGKFFKRVENTVGKGETAGYEQFLLFP